MGELIFSDWQLFKLFDALAVGAVLLSPDQKILGLNRAAELMSGVKAAQATGKACRNVFMDGWCDGTCRFDRTIHDEVQFDRFEVRTAGQTGEIQSLTRLLVPLGPEVGWLEVFQDHTAFKDLLKRIRYEDRRLKMILDALDLGVLTVDRGAHVTFFNTMAETLTGYSRQDILGKSLSILFHDDAGDNLASLRKTIADGESRSSPESHLLTRNGALLPVRGRIYGAQKQRGRRRGGLTTISDLSLVHQLNSAITERYTFF